MTTGHALEIFQTLRNISNPLGRRVWEIAPEQHVTRLRDFEQRFERRRISRDGCIEVKVSRLLQYLLRRPPDRDGRVRQHACDAVDQVRQRAAGVREDDLASGVGAQRAVHQQIHGRAPRFVRVVEHRLRQRGMDEPRVDGRGWMDEDYGLAPAELRPDGPEILVAEIVQVQAIAGVESDAISIQFVERVGNFCERGAGVKEGRERR